jgi:hypothetical protein
LGDVHAAKEKLTEPIHTTTIVKQIQACYIARLLGLFQVSLLKQQDWSKPFSTTGQKNV